MIVKFVLFFSWMIGYLAVSCLAERRRERKAVIRRSL